MTVRKIKEQKNGGKYIFDTYYDADGQRKRYRSKAFRTIGERKQAERDFFNHLENPEHTIRQIVDLYVSTKGREWKLSTRESNCNKLSHICDYMGNKRLSDLTESDYRGFLNYLDRLYVPNKKAVRTHYSSRYKNNVLIYMKAITKFAKLYYNESSNIPFMFGNYRMDEPSKMNFLTETQFEKFIEYVDDVRFKHLYTFLFYVGCRRGEALRLRFEDVNFSKRTITISKAWNKLDKADISPKTKSSVRTIPICDKAMQSILRMKSLYKKGRVFGGDKPLSCASIERYKDRAIEKSGVPYIRVHDLRHSFISMMLEKGANMTMVSAYVGHSSVTTTLDIYSHYSEGSLRSVIDLL